MSYDRRSNIVCCENCGTINKVMQLVPRDVMPERRIAPLVSATSATPATPAAELTQQDRLDLLKIELDQLGMKIVPKLKNSPKSQKQLKNAAACGLTCGFIGLVTVLFLAGSKHRR